MPFAWASIDVMKVMNEAADLRIHDNGKETDSASTGSAAHYLHLVVEHHYVFRKCL